jgi:hypothetical protein
MMNDLRWRKGQQCEGTTAWGQEQPQLSADRPTFVTRPPRCHGSKLSLPHAVKAKARASCPRESEETGARERWGERWGPG